jgi:hypothetical protein
MKTTSRAVTFLITPILLLTLAPSLHAATDPVTPDAQALTEMEAQAKQANPRDQCYLYTELVHAMTKIAVQQIADGDDNGANATLKEINYYAQLIQSNLAKNTKRLKNAQMLMDRTTAGLAEALHLTSDEDRTGAQATLKQLNLVQNQLLDQVFSH